MARPKLLLTLLTLTLVGSACSPDDTTPPDAAADLTDVRPVAALTPFDGCDALLEHLRREALERVGPYGLDGEGWYGPLVVEDGVAEGDDTASAGEGGVRSTALPSTPATTVPTSGTNAQEAFVDEADIVKVSPERLLVVDDDVLRVIDLTGDEPVARGTVQLPGWGHELLVVGDRVLAVGSTDSFANEGRGDDTWLPYGPATATLTEVDVSDPDDPTVVHSLELEGGYLSARLVGETARVVVSAAHPQFPFVYPSDDSPTARDIAEAANRRLVEESQLDDWLPAATLDEEPVEVVDCAGVQQPAEFSGFGFLSVLTVDLGEPLVVPPAATVLADGQTVYASTESLYVATSTPGPVTAGEGPDAATTVPAEGEPYETALHRFDITGDGPATWLASGTVPGHLLNQFSLSEHDGHLRVATTEGAPWDSSERAASRVAVLATDGQELVERGAVEGLGRTEQIHAVRFIGDTAYVVTFRQTDPLFVLDLSDPAAPSLEGELHIPGYSAYLHPLDEGHLLGIGQDATADGTTTGLQASVFDVTDPTTPSRTTQLTFPGEASAVEWDHRAFLHWPATDQAFLPTYQGTIALEVTPDQLTEQGRIATPGAEEVRRNVVVGDQLLTIGTDTLVTTDLATLEPLAQLTL